MNNAVNKLDPVQIRDVTLKLLAYCQKNDWAGYDPYDALNSSVFRSTPFFRSKLCRIALTQFMKRSPINLRPLLGVPKKRNPKGTALFISALLNLKRAHLFSDDTTLHSLIDNLIASRSEGQPQSCWGYSFDWQTRGYLVPEGSPNIICTTFAGNALLDAWETCKRQDCLTLAISAADFVAGCLCDEISQDEVCFNYTPLSSSRIHNANLLGAAYLARSAKAAGRADLLGSVPKAARYSVSRQSSKGSWPYGEAPTQNWIDNFHTGYNLCALQTIKEETGSREFDEAISTGLLFYKQHFVRNNRIPKYYHNRTYPIDIHSVAQCLLTFSRFADADVATNRLNCILDWTLKNMHSADGYFFYQKHPCHTNRVAYMRWGQAWMLLALSHLLRPSWASGERP